MRRQGWLIAVWLGSATGCTQVAPTPPATSVDVAADVGVPVDAVTADVGTSDPMTQEELLAIPAGSFSMGDHSGLGGEDPKHPSDELPLHDVQIAAFAMGRFEVTNARFVAFLHALSDQGGIDIVDGTVVGKQNAKVYADLSSAAGTFSRIAWDGVAFSVEAGKAQHPVTDIRWDGAIAYCNWLSQKYGFAPLCDVKAGTCDLGAHGFRLPTEAEWEYAGRGGQQAPYRDFPWGDDRNADGTLANWQDSLDPFEAGPIPWTTPVGFYDGKLHQKAEFGWPGSQDSYQTRDGSNGYGLHDMSGNAWELVYDWYANTYYAQSPAANPPGPTAGQPMPDAKPYRGMRGGNWYNGKEFFGHGRVSNRNPSYFRGPQDPNHPWYHVGFRVVLK